jgi:hypothetical protein
MIFKTKDPDVVAYLRACQVRDRVATVELMTDGGKVWGKVVSIAEIAEPEPIGKSTSKRKPRPTALQAISDSLMRCPPPESGAWARAT